MEAAKRGLSNLTNTPEALKAQITDKAVQLFLRHGIMNETEIMARYEIELEDYIKKVQIEGRVLGDIATNHIIPTAINYQNRLIQNVRGLKEIFGDNYENLASEQIDIIKDISRHITEIKSNVDAMVEERRKANKLDHAEEKAHAYCYKVKPYFEVIRYHCDKLEMTVDDEIWPLTKYRELLFTR